MKLRIGVRVPDPELVRFFSWQSSTPLGSLSVWGFTEEVVDLRFGSAPVAPSLKPSIVSSLIRTALSDLTARVANVKRWPPSGAFGVSHSAPNGYRGERCTNVVQVQRLFTTHDTAVVVSRSVCAGQASRTFSKIWALSRQRSIGSSVSTTMVTTRRTIVGGLHGLNKVRINRRTTSCPIWNRRSRSRNGRDEQESGVQLSGCG